MVAVGFALMCLFRIISHYGSLSDPVWWQRPMVCLWQDHVFNVYGFCYAWAYISVGAMMATTSWWTHLKSWHLWSLIVASLVFACFDTRGVCIGLQPAAFALVALCMRWNIRQESPWFGRLRQLSTYVYLTHVFVIMFACHTVDLAYTTIAQWLFCLAGSIVAARVVIWTKA